MGNLCSTPRTTCCKRSCPFPLTRRHARGCKRIKYTLVPQRDPDRQRRKAAALINNYRNGGSPNTLHRSNAIRRPGHSHSHSRSQSSTSPNHPHPSRLEIRNVTPPPLRPSSIVPTLMLLGTPSTDPPTSISRSSRTNATQTTSPTTPTTIISTAYNYSSSSSSAHGPQTLYMVDGEIVGSDEERLELRWIDALRAPGAPGGYRTVVDVVEGRRSGRLTVVNGGGGGEDSVRRGYALGLGAESVDGVCATRNGNGRPSYRGLVEEEMRVRDRYRKMMCTPVRRKPVPVSSRNINFRGDESPLALRNRRVVDVRGRVREQKGEGGLDRVGGLDENEVNVDEEMVVDEVDEETFARYRWRRGGPRGRPPIPSFESRGVTERELLDEVEDARRILERGGLVGGVDGEVEKDGVEDRREEKGGEVSGVEDGRVGGVEDGRVSGVEDGEKGTEREEEAEAEEVVCEGGNGEEQDEKAAS
ncbi:MAG: hypothetical protein Q9204_009057, partial [Flavoplaca sp. TL-2023a]